MLYKLSNVSVRKKRVELKRYIEIFGFIQVKERYRVNMSPRIAVSFLDDTKSLIYSTEGGFRGNLNSTGKAVFHFLIEDDDENWIENIYEVLFSIII